MKYKSAGTEAVIMQKDTQLCFAHAANFWKHKGSFIFENGFIGVLVPIPDKQDCINQFAASPAEQLCAF